MWQINSVCLIDPLSQSNRCNLKTDKQEEKKEDIKFIKYWPIFYTEAQKYVKKHRVIK